MSPPRIHLAHPVVSERTYRRFLRLPARRRLDGALAENATWAREWFAAHGHPWRVILPLPGDLATRLAERFDGSGPLVLIAASAGAEAETEAAVRWAEGEPDRYFFLESYASAVVEALLDAGRKEAGSAHFLCPGYPGWPIEDNHLLLEALQAAGPLPGPLTVLSSGMLKPKKSQLAVCPAAVTGHP